MCITPISLKEKGNNVSFPVDCGKCPECVKKRGSAWSFRLRKEAEVSTSAYFITLTYDTEHVPITKNGFMTLRPEDVTKWFKRLRKQHPNDTLKYFYVGEYGGQFGRPHYHLILFNADIDIVDKTWNYGAIHVGDVNGASIGYTLKYMIKDGKIPEHKNDDRLPEFARMSKGLGANYINEKTKAWHTQARTILERIHLTIDGKKISMPRYYKDKIYNEYHKWQLQFHAKAIQEEKYKLLDKADIRKLVEAHKAMFDKMYKNKYKGKNKDL